MTLGDDPFRKRDPRPDASAGAERGKAQQSPHGDQQPASGQYGQPPYSRPPYGQYGPPGYGPPPYGPPPYGPYGPSGQPPYGSPYPPPYGQPTGAPPPAHLGWAITAVIFFWPLAIAAFINYGRIESLWYRGDWAGAQRASASVKRYGVIALCIGIALGVLWIAFAATVIGTGATRFCAPPGNC
jgi:hypothetical protein